MRKQNESLIPSKVSQFIGLLLGKFLIFSKASTKILNGVNRMTIGTDSRNVKKIIQAILQSNGIDNLKCEADLFGAWMRYMNEREGGLTPAQVREKITAEYNKVGISAEMVERSQLKSRMETALGMSIDEGVRNWEVVINHCMSKDGAGETIEKFMEWCKADPYNSPKKHQIAQNPLLIKVMWNSAFVKTEVIISEPKFKDGSAYV
jgi:hypothetical protein